MGLKEYRKKRDFDVTSEPEGTSPSGKKAGKTRAFVIQKHDASHLHYDFRLELNGVLKSWAVPKGPSLNPAEKRLAVHVEDHPLEYGGFEGIIPEGEYGGGTVLLWDQGTWEPVGNAKLDYERGRLKFVLHGNKLHGGWMLVRRGGRSGDTDERHWFLFKERDEFAQPARDIVAEEPLSVSTGRNLDEIAGQASRIWGPNGETSGTAKNRSRTTTQNAAKKKASRSRTVVSDPKPDADKRSRRKSPVRSNAPLSGDLHRQILKPSGARRVTFPSQLHVELATLVKEAPDGDEWVHEIKFDGYRLLCFIENKKIRLMTRNGNDWTSRFPSLVKEAQGLEVSTAVLDGEVVVLQPDGTTSFQDLQNAFQGGGTDFVFYVFDLLYLNGYDTCSLRLEDRKELLHVLVPDASKGILRYSEHVIGNGPQFFQRAADLNLEGIISKRRDSPYTAGRSSDWLKVKCSFRDEFVIGGFTRPKGSRSGFGALLIGYYRPDGSLVYAGRVGTGFNDKFLRDMSGQLAEIVQPQSPFSNLKGSTGVARGAIWTQPVLVAQIQYSQWTAQGILRHPSFQGLREDKDALEIVREQPATISAGKTIIAAPTKVRQKPAIRSSTTNGKAHGMNSAKTSLRGKSASAEPDEVAGVTISHPDRVVYPDDGITKQDVAEYYAQVAEWMLPHVSNRLLSLLRCPDGLSGSCFFQKHPGQISSEHFQYFPVQEKTKTEDYIAVADTAGLVSLVQMGMLELHVWGSQADRFEKPDRIVFDLDPDPEVEWAEVVTAARQVKVVMDELKLTSFLKTTGGKGLHVVVPIDRRSSWDEVKTFSHAVADLLVAAAPDRYVATMSKAARRGKVFIDYLRNDRGATFVAPYSTRAKAGATVSAPIRWEELSNRLHSSQFNIRNVLTRMKRIKTDPWAEMSAVRQSLTASMFKKLPSIK